MPGKGDGDDRPLGDPQALDLEDLLQRCRRGDALAWEDLVRLFQGRVFGLARFYLRDREEARDVAQEAFIRIYRNLGRLDVGTNFTAWALRITRNCAIDRLRRIEARPPTAAMPDEDTLAAAPGTASAFADPVGENRQLLDRALELLSAAHREMILLKDIQGLEQREIAEMLSLPLGTVKVRASRARMELARRILELDPSYGTS
jgi:RNA polymerase sigma-70 factor (ECF subfamily)